MSSLNVDPLEFGRKSNSKNPKIVWFKRFPLLRQKRREYHWLTLLSQNKPTPVFFPDWGRKRVASAQQAGTGAMSRPPLDRSRHAPLLKRETGPVAAKNGWVDLQIIN